MTIIDDILSHTEELNQEIEHLKKLRTPLPIEVEVIQDTSYLPGVAEFKDFYADFNTFGLSIIEPGNGTITVITGGGKKIVFGIRGIAELVADKLNMPIHIDTDQQVSFAGKPNFVENVDAILKSRMDWVQAEFNKILLIDNDKNKDKIPFDPRIKKLCQDYHKLHSVPIIALCEYLKWERTLISYRLQAETIHIQDQQTSEIRKIQKDYAKKLDEDKATLVKRAEMAENNYSRLQQAYERDRKLLHSTQEDANTLKGEIEELHKKLTDSNAKNTKLEADLINVRTELSKLKDRVKDAEGDEWSIDFTSAEEKPTFCNDSTDEVISFPCCLESFRENYELQKERTDDGKRIFKSKTGEKVEIPESLAKAIPVLIKEQELEEKEGKTDKKTSKDESGMTRNNKKVLKAIEDSDLPLTIDEIAEITKIRNKEVSARHILGLIKRGYIEELKEGNIEKYRIKEKKG